MLPLYEINDATPNHASATHCYLKHADHPNVAPEARGNCSGGVGGFGLFFKFIFISQYFFYVNIFYTS